MIDCEHELPLCRLAELLKLSRSSMDDEAQPVPAAELVTMRQIGQLHLNYPFAGSRMLRDLQRQGWGRCALGGPAYRPAFSAQARKPPVDF